MRNLDDPRADITSLLKESKKLLDGFFLIKKKVLISKKNSIYTLKEENY